MTLGYIIGYYQTTPVQARALCARIATLLGYPRDGVTLDGVATSDGMTTLHVEPREHPTDATKAAVPIDDVIADLVDPTVQAAVDLAGDLDATWEPRGAG